MKNKRNIAIIMLSLLLSACSTFAPKEQLTYEQSDLWEAINQLKVDQTYFASKEEVGLLSDQINTLKTENQVLLQQIEELKKNQSKPKRSVAPPSSEISPEEPANTQPSLYQQAQNFYNKKQYSKTVQLLKSFAFGADHSSEAQNAMYLLGLTHLKLNHCEAAIDINRRFASLFAQHKNAPDALYNVLSCQVSLQQKDIARETYNLLQKHYPNSNAVIRAQTRLKQRGL